MYDIEPELKAKLVQLHVQEGRTFKSLSDEYGYPASTISRWVREYRQKAVKDRERAKALADMEKFYKLQKENEELRKENDFLKKRRRSLRRRADRSIQVY